MLFEWDIDVKDCQNLLGHFDIATTRNIYTHVRKSRIQATADNINNAILTHFENNAYVFIQEIPCGITSESYKYFEGLSKYSLDNHDVFAISPDQFLSIVPNSINDDICFIWVDGTSINRRTRYLNEKCAYNFKERDVVESRDIQSFVKSLYSFKNSPVLYFANEEPARVATIIYTLIKHPELLELYSKTFN